MFWGNRHPSIIPGKHLPQCYVNETKQCNKLNLISINPLQINEFEDYYANIDIKCHLQTTLRRPVLKEVPCRFVAPHWYIPSSLSFRTDLMYNIWPLTSILSGTVCNNFPFLYQAYVALGRATALQRHFTLWPGSTNLLPISYGKYGSAEVENVIQCLIHVFSKVVIAAIFDILNSFAKCLRSGRSPLLKISG